MSNPEQHLLDQLHEQRGNPALQGRPVRAVAIHPVTTMRLLASSEAYYHNASPQPLSFYGYPILKSHNLKKGALRVVPDGGLCYLQGAHGHPAVWPSPSITDVQGTHHLQEWPMDLAGDEVYAVDGPAQGERVKMREGQQRFEYREVTSAKVIAGSFQGVTYQDPRFESYEYEKKYGAPIISLSQKW